MPLVKVPTRLLGAGGEIQSVYAENTTADFACPTAVGGLYPNVTGGDEVANAVITPTNAASILEIVATFSVLIAGTTLNTSYCWIKKDGVVPVQAYSRLLNGDGAIISADSSSVTLRRRIVAGATTALTFRLYAAADAGRTCTVNPGGGEATLKVTEYAA